MRVQIAGTTFVLALMVGGAAAQSLGTFDSHGDLGITPKTGTAAFDGASGEYRVTGGGANIWGTEDAMQFVSKRVSGDFTLTADVRFVGTGAVAHRKAVLMLRQDLTPGSAYADVALHGDGLTALQFRPTAGAVTQETRSTITAPTRLRIERRGGQLTAFAGKPGEELAPIGTQPIALTDPVYAGLGVCSHDANVLETAVFSNVRLEQRPAAAPAQRYRSKVTVFDLKTRATRVVYQAEQVVEAPNWSRDGSFLMINTGGMLYKLPVNATGEPKLEKIPVGDYRCNNDHDFSRDGKMLAFSASSAASRQSQVWLANADGTGAKLMTPASPSYFHGWSPDGKWLAFVGQREGKFTLFRVPASGGAEERLTSKGYDDGPEYSPDGKWIYFNSDRSGNWDIWRMPVDGAGADDAKAEQVTKDELEDWFPHFSPNGKWMLVFSFPKGTKTHNEKMEGVKLRLVPAPGKTLKTPKVDVLATFFGGQGTINVNSWSPDSTKFAYVVFEPIR
ncbi:MAG: Periplasmic component of the Tol biopolymer transport system-like protein [Candidatus Solibacter sp.]|nr:Periplasmic component of the Tol biopolymer transport system-like protein [Candidatus Solibacter sp.]